ncbi:MAG TPA: precorrin-6y C5,15-methyltransferase (decarboxylating) subunit CbiE, partial [Propionibacteriaceae bacterium]
MDVVGIGARGWDSLGPDEKALVSSAARVYGSRRQLELLPAIPDQERIAWPSPLRPSLPGLLAGHQESGAVVLASGDPMLAGLGTTLVELFGADFVRVHPGVSSVALARARMAWPAESTEVVRLTESGPDAVRRHLAPGRRLIVLSRDRDSPAALAAVLRDARFGLSPMSVLSDLGGSEEGRRDVLARDCTGPSPDLNLVAVTCVPEQASALWSCTPGLPDEAYEHDGQLTKRDVRAAALAHLMPVPAQLLWDVGAGAGSVGIEWMRAHPRCRAVAVERDGTRAARIRSNAARLGVPELQVVVASAPAALDDLPAPDAVFVGGGATRDTLELAWDALNGGGRLVVHAVTHETELVVSD